MRIRTTVFWNGPGFHFEANDIVEVSDEVGEARIKAGLALPVIDGQYDPAKVIAFPSDAATALAPPVADEHDPAKVVPLPPEQPHVPGHEQANVKTASADQPAQVHNPADPQWPAR